MESPFFLARITKNGQLSAPLSTMEIRWITLGSRIGLSLRYKWAQRGATHKKPIKCQGSCRILSRAIIIPQLFRGKWFRLKLWEARRLSTELSPMTIHKTYSIKAESLSQWRRIKIKPRFSLVRRGIFCRIPKWHLKEILLQMISTSQGRPKMFSSLSESG